MVEQGQESISDKILSDIAKMHGISREELLRKLERRVKKQINDPRHIQCYELEAIPNLNELPVNLQKHIVNCGFCQLIIECEKGLS